ncbi:MAG TPA: M48 family metalloprotease [Caulobacteraceae bacterium]|nr:M48 family metalloprotease [Caulobacteraceae bacterium]
MIVLATLDAAAAWLARIPADQRIAAHAATDWRLAAWTVGGALLIGACVLVSQSGLLGRLTRTLEAARPRPWLASAAAACALALILATLKAAIDAFAGWRGQRILGGVDGGLGPHLAHAAAGIAPTVLGAVLLVPPALWLMRRRPRTWPLMVGLLVAGLIVAAIWLPYALSAGPASPAAPPGPVRDGLLRLIAETGIPAQGVSVSTDPGFMADVNGGFGHAKVIIGPSLAAGPPAMARALIGHIMGHYAHNDILIFSLVLGLAMLLGFFAVARFGAPLARLIGAKEVASAADPEAMPAAAIILMLAMVCAGLAGAGYLRWANVRADAYSLDHAREPDGLAAVIEQEWDHQSVDPSPIEEALFYTHPALTGRLRHAMAWKGAHGG